MTTLAGNGTAGFADGPPGSAEFDYPFGIAVDQEGNVYVADWQNNRIRSVAASGAVATWAGNGTEGSLDGPPGAAEFDHPAGITIDRSGEAYVADAGQAAGNARIRRVDPDGTVHTLAGDQPGGCRPGSGGAMGTAAFGTPEGIVLDQVGGLFVSDFLNDVVYSVVADGTTTIVAGTCGYVGSTDGPTGSGPGHASFHWPGGVAADRKGGVYVADGGSHEIREIDVGLASVGTLAGNGTLGSVDGPASSAEFCYPSGLAIASDGSLYVSDSGNGYAAIRVIDSSGNVSTLTGRAGAGYADGPLATAQFHTIGGIAFAPDGDLVVADAGNNRIRVIHLH